MISNKKELSYLYHLRYQRLFYGLILVVCNVFKLVFISINPPTQPLGKTHYNFTSVESLELIGNPTEIHLLWASLDWYLKHCLFKIWINFCETGISEISDLYAILLPFRILSIFY